MLYPILAKLFELQIVNCQNSPFARADFTKDGVLVAEASHRHAIVAQGSQSVSVVSARGALAYLLICNDLDSRRGRAHSRFGYRVSNCRRVVFAGYFPNAVFQDFALVFSTTPIALRLRSSEER